MKSNEEKRIIQEELKKRRSKPTFSLETYLFDKQLKFVRDKAPFKVAVTTRRAGKSVSCVADLTDSCIRNPNTVCLYITLSRKNAKRLVWPLFKRLNSQYKLGGKCNESDLSIEYPNGAMLYLLGANDKQSIEDFRGLPVLKVYLDESQSFPSYIEQLIDDVLGPALIDHSGTLCLIGTPGPVPSGYFFEACKAKGWSHHAWSYFDNNHLPFLKQGLTHSDVLRRELERRGVPETDPSIQREWYGRWVLDEDSLVFRYQASINNYQALPKLTNYTLGVDIGYEDADAIAVLGWDDFNKVTYVVEEKITRHQGITELVEQIEQLRKSYEISKIVMDTAGLGKKIAEEIQRRYSITILPAEKQRKLEFIELMNDALRRGSIRALNTSRFAGDCMKVEWDRDKSTPDKRRVSDRFHSDICDAVLYAWRESYAFTSSHPNIPPKLGSQAWYDAEKEKMEEAAEEFFKSQEEATKNDPFSDLNNDPFRKY